LENLFKAFALYNMAPPTILGVPMVPRQDEVERAVKQYGNRTVDVVVAE
jgi:hypothetical protein